MMWRVTNVEHPWAATTSIAQEHSVERFWAVVLVCHPDAVVTEVRQKASQYIVGSKRPVVEKIILGLRRMVSPYLVPRYFVFCMFVCVVVAVEWYAGKLVITSPLQYCSSVGGLQHAPPECKIGVHLVILMKGFSWMLHQVLLFAKGREQIGMRSLSMVSENCEYRGWSSRIASVSENQASKMQYVQSTSNANIDLWNVT